VEAPSRTRLQTLRGLLEFHAGELLRHTSDSFTTVDDIKQGILTGDRPPSPEPPPPTREMQEVAARAIAEHYQTWPDIPLPALQGKTPRDAVRTGSGRKTVVSLIRDIENLEQRKARQGEIPYDCNRLRRNLGLPEE
jgi:hypothetical protein